MMALLGVPESLSSFYFLVCSFFGKGGFEGSHDGSWRVEPELQMGGQSKIGTVNGNVSFLWCI